jgi:hypothetical protein
MFLSDAKARHDKMVGFTRRTMSDERGTMSSGHNRIAGLVETMMTADSLRPTTYGLAELDTRSRRG